MRNDAHVEVTPRNGERNARHGKQKARTSRPTTHEGEENGVPHQLTARRACRTSSMLREVAPRSSGKRTIEVSGNVDNLRHRVTQRAKGGLKMVVVGGHADAQVWRHLGPVTRSGKLMGSYLLHGGTTPFIRAYAINCPRCSCRSSVIANDVSTIV